MDGETRDFDFVIHKYESREQQRLLLEQLEKESCGLTPTRFQSDSVFLNHPESDIMDDRWHIQVLLDKMIGLLTKEFPDHRVEVAKSSLIKTCFTSDVSCGNFSN